MRRLIVHVINGLEQGGAETALYRLVGARGRYEDVHIISLTSDGYYGPLLRARGIPVTSLQMRVDRSMHLGAVRTLIRLLRRLRPCLVQAWLPHANLISSLAAASTGIPVCWGIRQADLSPQTNSRRTLLTAKICAWLSHWLPARIISCSTRGVAVHRDFGFASKFDVVPNGIDLSDQVPNVGTGVRIRGLLGIRLEERVIGHIGRFDMHKDYETLLNACGLLAQENVMFRLLMCGRHINDRNPVLRELITKHGLTDRVLLLGLRDDVGDLIQAMDILAMSSLSEAFPNVVVEAMALEVPCVATDVGDASEIIDQTGWIVPRQDPNAFAGAIRAALSRSDGERHALGVAARKRVESRYSVGRMVASYERIWDEVLELEVRCVD